MTHRNPIPRRSRTLAAAIGASLCAVTLTLAGCGSPSDVPESSPLFTAQGTLTVVTHDSFALSDEAKASFEQETHLKVTYIAPGDAGTVASQLILTKDAPIGDVVFGLDTTFAGRAIDAGVLDAYTSAALPTDASGLLIPGSDALTPIDYGDVCVNADKSWFTAHGIALPQTFADLTKPAYKGLFVTENPASSSPGLVMLAATAQQMGDPGYADYWKALADNGLKVDAGWTEAYSTDFSGSSGHGAYPLVLSYASSPAAEVGADGTAPTTLLPQTCVRQVEYAGVIHGAANPTGARQFIDFLLSHAVQQEIPDQMWMQPVDKTVELPADWAQFTGQVKDPVLLDPHAVTANRDTWIDTWTKTVLG